jgi:hypothetical protein
LEPVAEQKLANLDRVRTQMSRNILAQQFANVADGSAASSYFYSRYGDRLPRGGFAPLLIGRGGAVGYRPVIQQFPEGNQMMGMAIISADRRYVRFSLLGGAPIASGITNVDTFTFAGTDTGTQAGGGIGGGAGGGGFGGGGFGGGGGGFF